MNKYRNGVKQSIPVGQDIHCKPQKLAGQNKLFQLRSGPRFRHNDYNG